MAHMWVTHVEPFPTRMEESLCTTPQNDFVPMLDVDERAYGSGRALGVYRKLLAFEVRLLRPFFYRSH